MIAMRKPLQRRRERRRVCSLIRSARNGRYSSWEAASNSRQRAGLPPASDRACSASRRMVSSLAGFSAGEHCSASHRAASKASSLGFRAMLEHFGQNRLSLFGSQIMFASERGMQELEFGFDCLKVDALWSWRDILKSGEDRQFLAISDDLREISAMESPVGLGGSLQHHDFIRRRAELLDALEPTRDLVAQVLVAFNGLTMPPFGCTTRRFPTICYRAHAGKSASTGTPCKAATEAHKRLERKPNRLTF